LKLVQVLVTYFVPEKGIQVKIIDLQNLKGETADNLLKCVMDVLEKFHLAGKGGGGGSSGVTHSVT
jgi:hypothetical protein